MINTKPGVHFIAPYLLNPVHSIRVDLIGAGGTGSQMLSCLARIDHALRALDRKGLYVRVFDPDTVEAPNIGRQLYCESELGVNKAVALVSRFNAFFGTDWDARPSLWRPESDRTRRPNIIVSCVDNLVGRRAVSEMMKTQTPDPSAPEYTTWYWLDLGNAQKTGQAILGSADVPQPVLQDIRTVNHLPLFSEEFDIDSIDETDSGPSCSMADALRKQDLFVNSVLAQNAGALLWKLLREERLSVRGFYLNLDTLTTVPMEV